MNAWEYGENIETRVRFDFKESFDEQVANLKSNKGGSFKRGSHNYFVLRALFAGHTINDYTARPMGKNGHPLRNIRTRVADLRKEWNICIGSRKVADAPYKEYQIYGRSV